MLLAPDPEILEFPLKSYYRFALFPSREATRVIFQSLPAKHILTTRVDVPEPWNVQTKVIKSKLLLATGMTCHAVFSSTVHALLVLRESLIRLSSPWTSQSTDL